MHGATTSCSQFLGAALSRKISSSTMGVFATRWVHHDNFQTSSRVGRNTFGGLGITILVLPSAGWFYDFVGDVVFFRVTIRDGLRAHWGLLVNTVVNGPWPGVWEGFLSQFVLISSSLPSFIGSFHMFFRFFLSRAVCRGRAGCQVREGWLGFWQCWFWCLRFRVDNSWVGSWEEIDFCFPYEEIF